MYGIYLEVAQVVGIQKAGNKTLVCRPKMLFNWLCFLEFLFTLGWVHKRTCGYSWNHWYN